MKKSIYLKTILVGLSFLTLVACKQKATSLEGYIDADYTYIASNTSGNLSQLFVRRGDKVTKDQLLFSLEAQPEKYEFQNAQAHVTHAVAEMKKQQLIVNYYATLF